MSALKALENTLSKRKEKPMNKTTTKQKQQQVEELMDDELDLVEQEEEVEVPSDEQVMKMKVAELDEYHEMLPEALDNWDGLNLKQKRTALIEALHAFEEGAVAETEDTDSADVLEDEELGDVELDEVQVEDEVQSEIEEETQNVVKMRGSKGKAATKSAEPAKAGKKAAKVKRNSDPIDDAAHKIENLSEEEADAEALHLIDDVNYNYFRLGGVLSVIDSKKFYGEYPSFKEKIKSEFGLKDGKARQLVKIYNDILASGVQWEKLQHIGWTKIRAISGLITEDNVDEWIEKCETMNVESLRIEAKLMQNGGEDEIETSSVKKDTSVSTVTFKLHEDQKENVQEALELAMERGNTEHKSVALEYMALDFLGSSDKAQKMPTMKQFFDSLLKMAKGDAGTALDKLFESKAFTEAFPGWSVTATFDGEEVEEVDTEDDDLVDDEELDEVENEELEDDDLDD